MNERFMALQRLLCELWLCQPEFLNGFKIGLDNGLTDGVAGPEHFSAVNCVDVENRLHLTNENKPKLAVVPIHGMITKFTWWGASSVAIRNQLKELAQDNSVSQILLHIDSPGGTVAGTQELADEIRAIDQIKPVHAHIADLGASAAFWIASQARSISANATALVGSIGTIAVVADFSEHAKQLGIKVHVVATGKFKGSFAPGTKIKQFELDELQQRVDDLNEHFLDAIADGRDMERKEVEKIADGRVHIASKALALGMIDSVESFDESIQRVVSDRIDEGDARRRRASALIRYTENS